MKITERLGQEGRFRQGQPVPHLVCVLSPMAIARVPLSPEGWKPSTELLLSLRYVCDLVAPGTDKGLGRDP